MEVILKEDVPKLGHRGDVVKVAEGYGRNFLLPRKLAIEANEGNRAVIAEMKAASKRRVEVQRNKGLGEMDADDFWNTVLDPQRRTVIRVHLDDGEAKLHHTLLGGPPEGRRTWMADVASRVDTLSLDLT